MPASSGYILHHIDKECTASLLIQYTLFVMSDCDKAGTRPMADRRKFRNRHYEYEMTAGSVSLSYSSLRQLSYKSIEKRSHLLRRLPALPVEPFPDYRIPALIEKQLQLFPFLL